MYSPTLMNDWARLIEKWFIESQIPYADYESDIMKQELLIGFDELTEDFDRVFNDDPNDPNELEFSESRTRVRGENVSKEFILLHSSYPSNLRPNKNTRKNKSRKSAKPAPVQRRSLSRVETEGRESFDDVLVSNENIKVVLQLPINNKRENIQVIAYIDNSITFSYLSSEGKRISHTSALPYGIDIETARSTYRNGILEIIFDRK
jgi:HSP20 family molecular chaperone IbpA